MRVLLLKILNRKYSNSMNSVCYIFGMSVFSLSSLFLLMFINRISGSFIAGIFSIGWAVGQQMITVGLFGTRNVQVSDIKDNFKFGNFFVFRILSVILMFVICIIYIYILKLSGEQKVVSILLTLLMSGESFADVFAGYFQKTNRLAISGISYALRIIVYDILCVIVLFFTHSLIFSMIMSIIFSYLWLVFVDLNMICMEEKNFLYVDYSKLKQVFVLSFSIFVSSFLTNYIVNIPKNAISIFLKNVDQTYYNVLATPSFVISLFAAVFLVPMYTNIAVLLTEDTSRFKKIVFKLTAYLGLFTIIVCFLGEIIGIPIMNIIFAIDISNFKIEFALLIFAGGFSSLATLYIYILTILSYSKVLYWIYGGVAVIATILGNYFVDYYHLLGAALTYVLATFVIALLLLISVIISFNKKL